MTTPPETLYELRSEEDAQDLLNYLVANYAPETLVTKTLTLQQAYGPNAPLPVGPLSISNYTDYNTSYTPTTILRLLCTQRYCDLASLLRLARYETIPAPVVEAYLARNENRPRLPLTHLATYVDHVEFLQPAVQNIIRPVAILPNNLDKLHIHLEKRLNDPVTKNPQYRYPVLDYFLTGLLQLAPEAEQALLFERVLDAVTRSSHAGSFWELLEKALSTMQEKPRDAIDICIERSSALAGKLKDTLAYNQLVIAALRSRPKDPDLYDKLLLAYLQNTRSQTRILPSGNVYDTDAVSTDWRELRRCAHEAELSYTAKDLLVSLVPTATEPWASIVATVKTLGA